MSRIEVSMVRRTVKRIVGNDEFILIFQDISPEEAKGVVREAIANGVDPYGIRHPALALIECTQMGEEFGRAFEVEEILEEGPLVLEGAVILDD